MIAPVASRRWVLILISTAGLAVLPTLRASFGGEAGCPTPEGFGALEATLPKTAKALADGSSVTIVAIGGSSTLGTAAGGANLSWPSRLGGILAGRFPSARLKVVNLATPRQTARDAVGRLSREALPLRPTLVIWETGTVEAVRGTDVDEFRETVQAGVDLLQTAGIEVVVMNPQFSRDTDAMIHFGPYLTALRELADANNVPMFHRYGLMRYWAESGVLDLRTKDAEERRRLATRLYDCLGQSVADLVARK
jgi:lysophospholipase L1-like esterase